MKTYYFTISTGGKYDDYANFCKRSMERYGMELHIHKLEKDSSLLKCRLEKINGVRNIPSGYDRVFYIDSDTAMINYGDTANINGMLLEEVKHKKRKYFPSGFDENKSEEMYNNLNKLLDLNGISEMKLESGGYGEFEWNGGVLSADIKFANELVSEWEKWIYMIMEVHNGHFFRDQIALKYAYYNIGLKKHSFRSIPREWNWGIKWWGINNDAIILHEAGWNKKNKGNWRSDIVL